MLLVLEQTCISELEIEKGSLLGVEEEAQQLQAIFQDPGLVFSVQVWHFTVARCKGSKGSSFSFCPLKAHAYNYTHSYTHSHFEKAMDCGIHLKSQLQGSRDGQIFGASG